MSAKSQTPDTSAGERDRAAQNDRPQAFDEAAGGALTPSEPNEPATPITAFPPAPREKSGGWVTFLGGAFSVLWLGGAVAYLAGYTDLMTLTPAQLAGLGVFAVAPAMLFLLAGLLAAEVVRAGARARRLDAAVMRLAAPIAHADHDAVRLADAVSLQVDRVNQAMQGALARLAAMEEVISHHADSLEDSSTLAKSKADSLVSSLRDERLRLAEVADGLDDKAALIAAAIQDQSKMVAAAAELAEAKAMDGEKLIRSGADKLSAAGRSVEEAGDRIALSLDARATELRDFSNRLRDRTDGLEAAYLKHKDRLGEASETLRKEQEKIGAALDFHKAELETMSRSARDGAETLKGAAETSGAIFEKAVEEALERSSSLAREISHQSEGAAQAQEAALTRLQEAAEAARKAAEDAGGRLTAQASDAEAALERVSEAGFEAARRSDEAFQARLREAEELTTRAAKAAEDASEAVRRQLADTLTSANEETRRIETQLTELRTKMSAAPDAARDSVAAMEKVMQDGLDMLNQSAEEASRQARDIDAQFQARIRQNYELLSDFILRMGGVAGGRKPIDLAVNELPDPLSPRREGRAERASKVEATLPSDDEAKPTRPRKRFTPDVPVEAESEPEDQPGTRTDTSVETSAASDNTAAEDAPTSDDDRPRREGGWRWRDLLATMDPDETRDGQKPGDKPKD